LQFSNHDFQNLRIKQIFQVIEKTFKVEDFLWFGPAFQRWQDKESAIDNREKPYFMRFCDDKNGI